MHACEFVYEYAFLFLCVGVCMVIIYFCIYFCALGTTADVRPDPPVMGYPCIWGRESHRESLAVYALLHHIPWPSCHSILPYHWLLNSSVNSSWT